MTKFAVLSDSHGARHLFKSIENALRAAGAERLIHCGDGERDADELADELGLPLYSVAGNCDGASGKPGEIVLNIEDVKLLIRHGHRLRVKSSLAPLACRARETGAKVAIFGHTHIPELIEEDGVLCLNPGAMRDGCYALLTIDGERVSAQLKSL